MHIGERPKTIHDFGGFPRELYQQQYPAPGAPDIAGATIELVRSSHLQTDSEWGLDHGAWSVLIRMFPKANIPVFQLSLDLSKNPQAHLELARELKPLREKGVLVIGSGNLVHNLMALAPGAPAFDWARGFDADMTKRIEAGDAGASRRRWGPGASRGSRIPPRAFPARAVPARRRRREGQAQLLQRVVRHGLDLDALVPAFVTAALVVGAGPGGADGGGKSSPRAATRSSSPTPRRRRRANSCSRGAAGSISRIPSRWTPFSPATATARERLEPAIDAFPPEALRAWSARRSASRPLSARAGGCSRKASRRRRCCAPGCGGSRRSGVELRPRRRLIGLAPRRGAASRRREGEEAIDAPAIVLALGGASWPRLGGDGGWVEVLRAAGVAVAPLKPANCGLLVDWSAPFRERFAGAPLKAIALDASARRASRGEAMVTADGLEGGAIYALSARAARRDRGRGFATLRLDFKPDVSAEALARRLVRAPGQSLSTFLRKAAGLRRVAVGADARGGRRSRTSPRRSRARLKALPAAPYRRRADRAGDLQRGRGRVGGDRRALHAARPARGFRRRRDDRLGGADRRLSPAGGFFDRRGGGTGRGGVDGSPFLALTRASETRRRRRADPSFFQAFSKFIQIFRLESPNFSKHFFVRF